MNEHERAMRKNLEHWNKQAAINARLNIENRLRTSLDVCLATLRQITKQPPKARGRMARKLALSTLLFVETQSDISNLKTAASDSVSY